VKPSWVTHARSGSAIVVGLALFAAVAWGIGSWLIGWLQLGGDLVSAMRSAVAAAGQFVFWLTAAAILASGLAWGVRGMVGIFVGSCTLALTALTYLGYQHMTVSVSRVGEAAAPLVAPMALMVLLGFAILAVLYPVVGWLTIRAGVACWHAHAPAQPDGTEAPVRY